MSQRWSEMYQRGYDNAAVSFSYIPDFKNERERQDFNRGLKEGYARVHKIGRSKPRRNSSKGFASGHLI